MKEKVEKASEMDDELRWIYMENGGAIWEAFSFSFGGSKCRR